MSNNKQSARILENFVPKMDRIEARAGSTTIHNFGSSIESLMPFTDGATSTLLAAAADGNVYPVDGAYASLASGFSNARFQWCMMANAADEQRLVMVNGDDGIWTYDGTTLAAAVYTGGSDLLLDVTTHQGRLWFIERGTATAYYAPPLSNNPPSLTAFPIGPFLKRGGSLISVETITHDGGSGPDDYIIFATSEGEIVMFQGTDPGTDFGLVGLFQTSKLLGPRCMQKDGTDVIYYGQNGPQYLSELLGSELGIGTNTVPIKPEFQKNVEINPTAFGWDFVGFSKNSWMVYNVPILPPTTYHQFVRNINTQAWFRITGWNAQCWAELDNRLFFGDVTGKVIEASIGTSDDNKPIPCDFMQSWLDYEYSFNKSFNMAEVTIKSDSIPVVMVDMNVDYVEFQPQNTPSVPNKVEASPWDVSEWDISPWSGSMRFYITKASMAGLGYVGAFRYRTLVKGNKHELYGYRVNFEVGNFL